MEKMGDLLNGRLSTVNSSNNTLKTVNSTKQLTVDEKISALLEENDLKAEYVAKILSDGLSDPSSLNYYSILAKEHSPARLLEALSITKESARDGKIRTKKAIYFLAILRKWGLKTKFKKV